MHTFLCELTSVCSNLFDIEHYSSWWYKEIGNDQIQSNSVNHLMWQYEAFNGYQNPYNGAYHLIRQFKLIGDDQIPSNSEHHLMWLYEMIFSKVELFLCPDSGFRI